jgi:IS5 family transposase
MNSASRPPSPPAAAQPWRPVRRPCQGAARQPLDGHTLATLIRALEETIGVSLGKIVPDAGHRGHDAPKDKMLKVHVGGYKRGLTKTVKRALPRRAAVEPVIGRLKNDHCMGRKFLAFNAVLAAVGHNFSLLLNCLRLLCAVFLVLFAAAAAPPVQLRSA